MPLFDVDYLKNGTTYIQWNTIQWNTNRNLHIVHIPTRNFELPLQNYLAKFSTIRIVPRPICDSWASCCHCRPTHNTGQLTWPAVYLLCRKYNPVNLVIVLALDTRCVSFRMSFSCFLMPLKPAICYTNLRLI